VFDRHSGVLLDSPSIDAIRAIRQLTLMFGKIGLKASDSRTAKAMLEFVECEKDVRETDARLGPIDLETFNRVSSMLFGRAFTWMDHEIYLGKAIPKHGPGVTADRLLGNQKFNQRTWTSRLEEIFPAGEFLLPNWKYYDQLDEVDILEPGSEIPVKVVSVPKTLKTPRIIAIEPTAMQYAQQAVLATVLGGIRRDANLRSFLGFDDQAPNQLLAEDGSRTGNHATLDLSEASDRVSNELVMSMLHRWPHLRKAFEATRSTQARVPGHGVIPLAKFASMGSALCFPTEAMVFLTMVFIGIERELSTSLSPRIVKQFRGRVRIYGDDIIVPVEYVQSVVASLEHFGAKVNVRKSFWTGKFRESCGKEYYAGEDVSVVRVRHLFPTQRTDVTGVISLVSLRNQLYYAGYWQTVKWLDQEIRKVLKYFPTVSPSSPVLGRWSVLGYETQKEHPNYHSPLVKGYVVHAPLPRNTLDGEGALLKFFLDRAREESEPESTYNRFGLINPVPDEEHLERSGRPQAVYIKLRWASPF